MPPVQNAQWQIIYPMRCGGVESRCGVTIPADMRVSITNTSNPEGYPITGFSWIDCPARLGKSAELKKFLNWVITTGQALCRPLDYAPVPEGILAREQKVNQLRSILIGSNDWVRTIRHGRALHSSPAMRYDQ